MALAFGGTFVIFGVGSGGSGLGDLLFLDGGGASGDQPSVDEAREQTLKNPRSAEAWDALSTALQTEGETDEAITALTRYTELRPSDREKLEELAGLYLAQGERAREQAQIAQFESQLVSGAGLFTVQLQAPKGQTVDLGPGQGVEDAVTAEANEKFNEHFQAMTTAFGQAQAVYEKVVRLAPNDPAVYQNLALAAHTAGDTQRAVEAYEKFLKLAPDDPSATIIREQLKQLKASLQPATQG